ncbi:helix-turn-helix domain-containing protein [Thetidibacter halocola]|uniref:Helix-turn-helix transcriptional regulator n=1 Tax=Thetidibacter halocola TaxID=2827239 RepID=A0A8J7W7X4_9RHOB|nr:helix-turn-helix transcriptional regulator [Thetidibacter halocola]
MTGADLRAARLAQGWSLRELARRAGVSHRAVAYWEARPRIDPRGHAPKLLTEALGLSLPDSYRTNTRTRERVLPIFLRHAANGATQARDLRRSNAKRHALPCKVRTRQAALSVSRRMQHRA